VRWLLALFLAGCSGAVSDPANNPAPPVVPALAVTPISATAYPGVPTTFFVSGGTGPYTVVSDNQAVIPNPNVSNGAFTVTPNAVTAQTELTLALRDATSTKSIPVTVEPTAKLTANPAALAFQGNAPGTCASAIAGDVLVYGGVPPYVATQPPGFTVNPSVLTSSPGRLTIFANGVCSAGAQVSIVDAIGSTASVTVSNALSATPAPTVTDIAAAPTTVTLTGCTDTAHIALAGGSGHYFAVSGSSWVYANVDGLNTGIITRAQYPAAQQGTPPASVPVVFSDGSSTVQITVNLPGTPKC
jgi:hypothetical protein